MFNKEGLPSCRRPVISSCWPFQVCMNAQQCMTSYLLKNQMCFHGAIQLRLFMLAYILWRILALLKNYTGLVVSISKSQHVFNKWSAFLMFAFVYEYLHSLLFHQWQSFANSIFSHTYIPMYRNSILQYITESLALYGKLKITWLFTKYKYKE